MYARRQKSKSLRIGSRHKSEKSSLYDKAIVELNKIIDNYYYEVLADDALYRLALIYADVYQNYEKSKELLLQLITDFPISIYVDMARMKLNKMKNLDSL
jgi:outer membrane protein assembly factor BamD (BamD/ComL family)